MKERKEGEAIYDSVIEMTGLTSEFTINQTLDHFEYCKKQLKEAETQLSVNNAQNQVAEAAIPALKDIPEGAAHTAQQYFARKASTKAILDLIETCRATIATYEARLQEISEKFGIEMPSYAQPDVKDV